MNAQQQATVSIPTLIRIFTLLITLAAGAIVALSEEQVIQIPETRAITLEEQSRQALDRAIHDGAKEAALQTGLGIAADLAVELKHAPVMLIATSETVTSPIKSN